MGFNLDTWKQTISENFEKRKPLLKLGATDTVYGALALYALLPAALAFQQGEMMPVAVTLVTLLGDVGAGLISNLIQNWKDRSDREAAQEILGQAQKDEKFRQALDRILEQLEVLQAAEKHLSSEDRKWFQQTLQAEARRLGSSIHIKKRYHASAKDSAVINQGDQAKVLGKNAILVEAGASLKVHQKNIYPGRGPESAGDKKTEALLRNYLERQKRDWQQVLLGPLGGEDDGDGEATLEDVYVALDTTQEKTGKSGKESGQVEIMKDRLSALDAYKNHRKIALLGDPGSGKSTFVKYLLAWQAAARLGEKKKFPPGTDRDLLPVFLMLRDLVPHLERLDLSDLDPEKCTERCAGLVVEEIHESLGRSRLDEFKPQLQAALDGGRCLLVLDGLDEVPQHLRPHVRLAVKGLLRQYSLERMVITCRARSYGGEAVLPDFHSFRLAPFDEEKIRLFVRAWYHLQEKAGRLNREQAGDKAQDLEHAALEQDLFELSSNPMMLTSMAIIHQKEIGLPKERVRLYKLVVEVLLLRWQKQKVSEKGLAGFLKDDLRLKRAMEHLAYEAHASGERQREGADLPRGRALTILEGREFFGTVEQAGAFLDYVDQRAGLLVGRGGEDGKPLTYGFPHRTFQEYLAGCHLVGQRSVIREYLRRAGEGDAWSLAAQLGAEELHFNRDNTNGLLDLAYGLFPAEEAQDEPGWRALLWSGRMAEVVGRDRVDADADGRGRQYLKRLIPGLVRLLGEGLPAVERAEAGRALGQLGDPRTEILSTHEMRFCRVPAGAFLMGSRTGDPDAFDDEYPQGEIYLQEYWVGRSPVSNAQFGEFVQADGYREAAWWEDARRAGTWSTAGFKGRLDDTPRLAPYEYAAPFHLANHPVVGVSWYEALAFCRWLEARWRAQGVLPGGWRAGLPSEAQWEKAARGGLELPAEVEIRRAKEGFSGAGLAGSLFPNPQPGRAYPWEGGFDAGKCNMADTAIGASSTPGCFPAGASPYGVLDLSGNVWEWTSSIFKEYPYDPADGREDPQSKEPRVWRGGAFDYDPRGVRCAFRYGDVPNGRNDVLGFRIILSPLRDAGL